MTGTITDIHRTSVVDGPGLRTTVFLKGCPLRCPWCHNPETQSRKIELAFDSSLCRGCGCCVEHCPQSALTLDNSKAVWNRALCNGSLECVAHCPTGALFAYGKSVTDDHVLSEVLKDRDYYDATGGGVTISGGEPMSQPEFTLSLLGKARAHGIHTVLDTSGFMSRSLCERTLENTSLYLFDFKASNPSLHLQLTGAPLEPILGNLEFLLSRGTQVILRCPLVPGVNDDIDHLHAIARMENLHGLLAGIDILPWHSMGRAKYSKLGRPTSPSLPEENAGEEKRVEYRKFFADRGCRKVTVH